MKSKPVVILIIVLLVGFFGFAVFAMWRAADNVPSASAPPTSQNASSSVSAQASGNQSQLAQTNQPQEIMKHLITIKTSLGNIQFATFDDDAPKTVNNFITLAEKGFYDNVIFHRVIKGFMIQGGDPTGTGRGGPGYSFDDELNSSTPSYQAGYVRGVVAMANAGPNTNGSQFFIMLQDTPLPHAYTIFGKVVAGQDIVDAIGNLPTDSNDKPLNPPVIEGVTVAAE